MSIYKRGNVWWMDVYVGSENRRVRKSTGTSDKVQARIVEQAAMALNKGITQRQRAMQIIDAIMPETMGGLPVKDMVAFYKAAHEQTGESLLHREMNARLNLLGQLAQWCHDHTHIKFVSEIDSSAAWQFASYASQGNTAKTRNNKVGHLRTAWKIFMTRGKASENPWTLARVQRNPEEERHGRAFTADEEMRILAACRKWGHEWDKVFTVAMYTGLRLGDVVALEWSQIDRDAGMIRLKPSKTKRRNIAVNIPMHEKVLEVVAGCPKDGKLLFPWRQSHRNRNTPVKGDCNFVQILKDANVVAGAGEVMTFHCTRHSLVTELAEVGVSEDVRMKIAGHTNPDTHAIYTHDETVLREAIGKLK